MSKYIHILFFIFILFFSLNFKANASVLYEITGIGTDIIIYDTGYVKPTYKPDAIGTGNISITSPVSAFYTSTIDISYLKVKTTGGTCAGVNYDLGAYAFIYPWASPFVYTSTSAISNAGYTTFAFVPAIPSGTAFNALSFNFGNISCTFDGSLSNSGASYDGSNVYVSSGGYAFQLCDTGGCSGGFTSASCIDGIQNQDETGIDVGGVCTTRITNISPINGSTTASTNIPFSFDYFLNALDQLGGETGLKVYLTRVDNAGQGQTQEYLWNSIYTGTLTTLTHTFTLPSGSMWDYSIWFERDPNYLVNEYQTTPLPNGRFSVVTDPTTGITGYVTCDISNLAGCFQNAIIYLFYPSSNTLAQFSGLKNIIINKPPIGYVYGVITALGSVNLSATPTLAFTQFTPVNTYVFLPFRAGLVWVLWFIFLFLLFKRFQHLEL